MSGEMTALILTLTIFVANMILLFQIFPSRFDLRVSIAILVLFAISELLIEYLLGSLHFNYGGLRGLLYFPLLIFLLKGTVFQKLFAFSLELVFTVSISLLVGVVVKYIFEDKGFNYSFIIFAIIVVICTVYVIVVTKNRNIIYEKLFEYGSKTEWAIYSFVGLFSFGIMSAARFTETRPLYFIAIMLFILLSFGVLCFAIINTNEKSKQRYEAELARNVISSGREHYQKMDKLYDKLRILRHDYKHHLSVTRELLNSGGLEKADKYLTAVEKQMPEYEWYCSNSVLNALIASYAERCEELNIKFDVKVNIPENLPIPNYDMCIILGNLLENAVEACKKNKTIRKTELVVKPNGTQLVIAVKNSFDGHIVQVNEIPVSMKKDGGLGLRSIAAVADRYGGELLTEWDTNTFIAYVTVSL